MTRPPRVLVAESDALSREILAAMLRIGGFEPVEAESGERALAILRRERGVIDWAVTRLDLGGLACGWIVADEFRALRPDRAVVFAADRPDATALGGDEAVFAGDAATAVDLLDLLKALVAGEAARAEAAAGAALAAAA